MVRASGRGLLAEDGEGDKGPLERILRERMWSRSKYAITTVGQLRDQGYELVATGSAPHYSVVLPAAVEAEAAALLEHFGPTLINEFKQRRK